jgi:hypothetical protein
LYRYVFLVEYNRKNFSLFSATFLGSYKVAPDVLGFP